MMKSVKEVSVESKILKRLQNHPKCLELVHYLFNDAELQEMQDYANNVSIKRLGYNDHGPVHMRQVTANAIKMLNILHESGIQTSLEREEIGTFEDSMCAVILAGLMHDLGMMIGREGHEQMSVTLAKPIIERAGYYDGYVVALYLANGGSTLSSGWGKNDKIYTINNIPDEYNATNFAAIVADLDGLTHCKTAYAINGYSYTGLYAINAANAYGTANHTEAAAPAKSSGWYLPSIGQLYATVVNFSASSSYNSLLTAAYSTSNWGAQYNGTYGFALSNGSAYSDLKSKVNAFITAAGLTGQDGNAYAAGKFQQYFTNYYTWASTEAYADQAWYINWGGKLQLGTQGTQGRKKAVLDIYARPVLAF